MSDTEIEELKRRVERLERGRLFSLPVYKKPGREILQRPTLCDYCRRPFGFDEVMTRIEHGPGKPCDLVHAACASPPETP